MKKFLSCLTAFMFLASVSFAGTATNIGGGIWVNGVNYNMDWAAGNVTYVPSGASIATYITNATAGDTLQLAAGTYTITDDIDVTKAVNIVGQGIGKTIINNATANVDVFVLSISNIRISDLTITNSGGTNYKASIKSSGNLTGIVLENIRIVDSKTGTAAKYALYLLDTSAVITNVYGSTAGTGGAAFVFATDGSANAATTITLTDCYGISTGATSSGISSLDLSSSFDCLVYAYGGYFEGITTGVLASNGADAFLYAYGSTLKGGTQDVLQANSATVTLYDCTLVNGTTSGTITYDGTVVSEDGYFSDSVTVGKVNFAADAQASDTYVITLSPAPTAYTTGMTVVFTATTANTGACTLNVNALGAKALKSLHDQDPADGYIEAGSVVTAVYDGTNFQIQNPDANP